MEPNHQAAEAQRRGLSRDMSRLKDHGTASAAEVRDYIRQMRGRSPQEVLGSVAQSSLVHGVTVATILTVAFFAIFTYLPIVLYGSGKKAAAAPATAPNQGATPAQAASQTPAAEQQPAAVAGPGDKTPVDKVLEGVSETKTADPGRNPLEDKADDLLKDLK